MLKHVIKVAILSTVLIMGFPILLQVGSIIYVGYAMAELVTA